MIDHFYKSSRVGVCFARRLLGVFCAGVLIGFGFAVPVDAKESWQQRIDGAQAQRSVGARGGEFNESKAILKFINDYRDDKQPDRVPDAIRAMVRLGLLNDPEKAGIYIGFLAGFIGENQISAEKYIEQMFPLPPREQVVLIKAIAYSGLPEWKDLLGRFVERMPARKVMIKKYLYGKGKTLRQLKPQDGPNVIDVLWGYYFATGWWEPAQRIIAALALAQEKNDVEVLTIGAMAKWTLATNATRDKNLLDLAKAEMNHQPETVRQELREVIEAAELFETNRLREKAIAAIDQLKVRGPERIRNWNFWGQAGTTALALGCVAASALGQVQVGIPCVVGGALSQAAVKVPWTKEIKSKIFVLVVRLGPRG